MREAWNKRLESSSRKPPDSVHTNRADRLPAVDLPDQCIDVWQVNAVVKVRQAIGPNNRIQLRLSFGLRVRVVGHGQQECEQRGDGGIGTGWRVIIL